MNIEIRHVAADDKTFWMALDNHLSGDEFDKKVRDKQGYVLSLDGRPVGILRYNLFWDNTPFCTMLFIDEKYRGRGAGKALMTFWESEMRALGFTWALASTRSDEDAQYFYRKLGYRDCGEMQVLGQPPELFLSKKV